MEQRAVWLKLVRSRGGEFRDRCGNNCGSHLARTRGQLIEPHAYLLGSWPITGSHLTLHFFLHKRNNYLFKPVGGSFIFYYFLAKLYLTEMLSLVAGLCKCSNYIGEYNNVCISRSGTPVWLMDSRPLNKTTVKVLVDKVVRRWNRVFKELRSSPLLW